MKENKKAILAIAVTLLLAAALFVGAAGATDNTVIGYGITQYTYTGYTSLTAFAEVTPFKDKVTVEGNCLILQNDIELTEGKAVIICGEDITLNLNGYMLKAADGGSYAIYVQKNAKLTLCDEITDTYCTHNHVYVTAKDDDLTAVEKEISGGLITTTRIGSDGYLSSGSSDSKGSGIRNEGTLIMESGTIAGVGKTYLSGDTGRVTGYYGGVQNMGGGTFTMKGGVISDTFANYGGNVYNKEANTTFILEDGKLTRGFTGYGGAVYNGAANTTFTMSGGELSDNVATYGAVYNTGSGSSIKMSGGKVINNKGEYGGGFNLKADTTFVMSGGEISGNLGQYKGGEMGGGVYVNGGSFTMSGGKIYNNSLNLSTGGTTETVSCDIYENNNNALFTISSTAQIGTPEYPGAICLRAAYTTRPVFTIASGCTPNQVAGYTFNGWFDKETEGTLKIGPGAGTIQVTGDDDIWLYPQWTAQAVTVTFDKNGGTTDASPNTIDEVYGSTYKLPDTNPTWAGQTFAGWFTEADAGTEITAETTVVKTETHTLYAHWTVNQYTATFDANGGTPVPVSQIVEEGKTVTKPATDPTKDGFHFAGWYNGDELYDFATPVTSNLTLKAGWARIWTVSFDADEGLPAPSLQMVIDGKCATEPQVPEKEGFSFAGWYNGDELYNFNTPVTQDLTLTTHWSEIPVIIRIVTFDAANGTDPVEQEVIDGGYVIEPQTIPTKDGCEFLGWFVEGEEVKYDFTNFQVKQNFTLIAHWKVTSVPADPTQIIEDIETYGEDVVVAVTGTEEDKEKTVNLIKQAQEKGEEVAARIQLEVTSDNIKTIADVITEAGTAEMPVPVVVTGENKAVVKELFKDTDEGKVSLPVDGNGGNIESVLEIFADHQEATVPVPGSIVISGQEGVTIPMDSGKEMYTEKLYDIAEAVNNGESAEMLTLDLMREGSNVQDAINILGTISNKIEIQQNSLPDDVEIKTELNEINYTLTPKEAGMTNISIVKMDGGDVSAVAVTKKEEMPIGSDVLIPEIPASAGTVHSIFQIVVPEKSGPVDVTLHFKASDKIDGHKFRLKHCTVQAGMAEWDNGYIEPKTTKVLPDGTYECTYTLQEFSPFGLVSVTPAPKSGGSSAGGSSTWLTEPTAQPTPTPTPGAVETPSVQPIEKPSDSSAKTPAPFIGILAGLGAAAVIFGLRRK